MRARLIDDEHHVLRAKSALDAMQVGGQIYHEQNGTTFHKNK